MDYLYFKDNEALSLKAKRLFSMPIDASRAWDLETLDKYDLVEDLWELVSHPYVEDKFVDEGLWNLFRLTSTVYKELLIEFLTSFNFEEGPHDENFNTRKCITFRLSETWHKMSLIGFAKGMGIVDRNYDENIYKAYLDKATVGTPPGFDLKALWKKIGMSTFDARACMETHLSSPLYRLLHRFLANTILFHPQQDLVSPLQLRGFWYVLHPETRWNLPHAMALMFKQASEERFNVLPGGQFVTHLAIHLGVLNHFAMYACTPIQPINIGLPFYVQIMILKRLKGDKFRLYKKKEPKEEEQVDVASSSQNDGGFDVKKISKQLDKLGWYLDDINRQNAANRNIALMEMWNSRMGYTSEENMDNNN